MPAICAPQGTSGYARPLYPILPTGNGAPEIRKATIGCCRLPWVTLAPAVCVPQDTLDYSRLFYATLAPAICTPHGTSGGSRATLATGSCVSQYTQGYSRLLLYRRFTFFRTRLTTPSAAMATTILVLQDTSGYARLLTATPGHSGNGDLPSSGNARLL